MIKTRNVIIGLLREKPRTSMEMAEIIGTSRQCIGYHCRILADRGLVEKRVKMLPNSKGTLHATAVYRWAGPSD